MSTSLAELEEWFHLAEEVGATHMLIVWDSWEDYPVLVMENEDVSQAIEKNSQHRIMEVYKISLGWEAQGIGGKRVWNL